MLLTCPTAGHHPLSRGETWILASLLFFLPLLEAPKNLLWLAFVLLWLGNSFSAHSGLGGKWQTTRDLPFIALISAAFLSCFLADPFPQRWREVGDVLRYALLGWLLSRSRISEKQLFVMLALLLAGTLLAAIHGWWQWRITHQKALFELHSVGHTNHSAIYLAMVCLGTIGALLTLWGRLSLFVRVVIISACIGQTWLIATGESRGGLLTCIIGVCVIAAITMRAKIAIVITSLILIALAGMIFLNPYLINKFTSQMGNPTASTQSSYRIELARTGLVAFRDYPLTGIGPGNFSILTQEKISTMLAERKITYDPGRYFHSSHAHNIYVNTLTERGLIGFIALICLAWIWASNLIKRLPLSSDIDQAEKYKLEQGVSAAGFIGVFVAGIFNTSLHHEHGLLAMFMLGILLANRSHPQGYFISK